jgi:hypothetical protein
MITPCVPCGTSPVVTNVPGSSGASAITVTSASFVIPAVGATVAVSVGDTSWIKTNANVFISDGSKRGNFLVTVNSAVSITAQFLGFQGDSAAGGTIASGAIVMPGAGDLTFPNDLDLLTAFTDNSGGTKSDTIAATCVRNLVIIGPFTMALLVNSQVWKATIPYAFTLNSVLFRANVAITTAAKAATLTAQINGTPTTGGVVAVSGTYATGATQAGTAVSGANTGTAGQTLEIAVSGVTAFTEGNGLVELSVTNNDLAATIAAIAFKANQLRTALRHI